MTNWQRRMRREGRCTECGRVNDRAPKWLCASCFEKAYTEARKAANRAYGKRQRALWILAGLCTRCGRNPSTAFSWCLDCRQDHAERRAA